MNYAQNRAVKGTPDPLSFSATIDPAAVGIGAVVHEAFTVNGVLPGDIVLGFDFPQTADVAICNARVSAANQVTLTFTGGTAGGNPASGTLTVYIARPGQPGPGGAN